MSIIFIRGIQERDSKKSATEGIPSVAPFMHVSNYIPSRKSISSSKEDSRDRALLPLPPEPPRLSLKPETAIIPAVFTS